MKDPVSLQSASPQSATQRVEAAALRLDLPIAIRSMSQPTRTAAEAAHACGCDIGQIVKSLIFRSRSTGRAELFLVSGANRVDEEMIARHAGGKLERADAAFVRSETGFAIGGVPPFGHRTALSTYMDESLLTFETVWAAAGAPNAVFSVNPVRLRDAVGAKVIPVS